MEGFLYLRNLIISHIKIVSAMKEYFLHHLWKWGLFHSLQLITTTGKAIQVIHPGHYLEKQGPDFFNAIIFIDSQKWAGNIEIHLKSSDWYVHHHESDPHYDNVILHVVWEHDMEVFDKEGQEIPVLVLKDFVEEDLLSRYHKLMEPKTWIYCESQLKNFDDLLVRNWLDRLYVERLSHKAEVFKHWCHDTNNHWEEVLFWSLATAFGLHANSEAFYKIATSIRFDVFKKEVTNLEHPEALLLGAAGLLEGDFQEQYPKILQNHWQFVKSKYALKDRPDLPVTFYKVRPDSFPTIRLVQLTAVYRNNSNLFQKVIEAKSKQELGFIFKHDIPKYWKTHYVLDRPTKLSSKSISDNFLNLITINSIIPLKFAYMQWGGTIEEELIFKLMEQLPVEKNKIIDFFNLYGISSSNAMDSQALVQLKTKYCDHKRCLECDFGKKLVKAFAVP